MTRPDDNVDNHEVGQNPFRQTCYYISIAALMIIGYSSFFKTSNVIDIIYTGNNNEFSQYHPAELRDIENFPGFEISTKIPAQSNLLSLIERMMEKDSATTEQWITGRIMRRLNMTGVRSLGTQPTVLLIDSSSSESAFLREYYL